ncbi:Retinitis pigmentosa 9 protein [Trichoplax sp. H2]|nr:Retinitis pigmentosa 9 protein [Trichoplax sp. H2]|eukprot:RDD46973.1 Retinitis pigmentosa 9 protein [Trichoplax sp. H2]
MESEGAKLGDVQPEDVLAHEDDEKPEDCIPDLPENVHARKFLANAPSRGLWMPLGKEVKVMQCWRCKAYGHRTGDKECPYFISGNRKLEEFRISHEDPMHNFVKDTKRTASKARVEFLKSLLEDSTSSDSSGAGHHRSKKHKTHKHKKKSKKKKSSSSKQHRDKKDHKYASSSSCDERKRKHKRSKEKR